MCIRDRGVIPALNFGSTNIGPNAATVRWEGRFPLVDIADSWTVSDNLTKIWRSHQFKTGVAFELVHYLFVQSGPSDVWSGRFDFAQNTGNTSYNTTSPYANMLLGYFNTYQESTNRTQYSPITPILEFYVQDSWKAAKRLTLDLGVRFTVGVQQYQGSASQAVPGGYQSSSFVQGMYNAANAPILYQPALNGSTRVAIDPRSPTQYLPEALVGQIVPGTGNLMNGIVVSGQNGYPRALVDYQGILPAPRAGFAWDIFGDGSTAMRGGFGMFYNPRNGSGVTGDMQSNPPNVYQPQVTYGSTATFLNAQGTITPPDFARTATGGLLHEFKAAILASRGDRESAVDHLRAGGAIFTPIDVGPRTSIWRSRLAVLLRDEEPAEARRLVTEELSAAERLADARSEGVALRALGLIEGGDALRRRGRCRGGERALVECGRGLGIG